MVCQGCGCHSLISVWVSKLLQRHVFSFCFKGSQRVSSPCALGSLPSSSGSGRIPRVSARSPPPSPALFTISSLLPEASAASSPSACHLLDLCSLTSAPETAFAKVSQDSPQPQIQQLPPCHHSWTSPGQPVTLLDTHKRLSPQRSRLCLLPSPPPFAPHPRSFKKTESNEVRWRLSSSPSPRRILFSSPRSSACTYMGK